VERVRTARSAVATMLRIYEITLNRCDLPLDLKRSEFQTCAEVEPVTLDALGDIEVVNPARAKIEVALTQLGGVGNDRANAESAAEKTVKPVGRRPAVVVHLLNPAFDKADAEAALEAFDGQHFQIGDKPGSLSENEAMRVTGALQ